MEKSKNKYVLIKFEENNPPYYIMDKENNFIIIEDNKEMIELINMLIFEKVEIFQNYIHYINKYISLTEEEKKAKSMVFWWVAIPKEKWTNSILNYFNTNKFWKEYVKNIDIEEELKSMKVQPPSSL
jgi:hypothetical protein